jgi:hypothetical protein
MRRPLDLLAVMAVAVAAVAVACGAGQPRGGWETRAPGAATPALMSELDFSVPALGGGQIEGRELAGRDVALWFWAPW